MTARDAIAGVSKLFNCHPYLINPAKIAIAIGCSVVFVSWMITSNRKQ